jgi:hypothetical protein
VTETNVRIDRRATRGSLDRSVDLRLHHLIGVETQFG